MESKKNELKVKKINDIQKENIITSETNYNEETIIYSKESKEELKNIINIKELIKENSPKLLEQIENLEYLGSGGESNVYKLKPKKRKKHIY